jgi:hypothetical protein
MFSKCKIGFIFFGVILLLLMIAVGHSISSRRALRKHDSTRLASFVHQIEGADRIVGTFRDSKIGVTLTGDDVQKLVRAVASASSHRPPTGTSWQMIYDVNAVFYKGTNTLGDIEIGQKFFLLNDSGDIPFEDKSGTLKDLIMVPAYNAWKK